MGKGLSRVDKFRIMQRRAKAAGLSGYIRNHSFRGPGITFFPENSGASGTAAHPLISLPCERPSQSTCRVGCGRTRHRFHRTLQRLAISFASLKRFTADASHKPRTPSALVLRVGGIHLRGGTDGLFLWETIGRMSEEAQRLNDLIDSLLKFAQVEGSRANFQLEFVFVEATDAEVCGHLEDFSEEKDQRISTKLPPRPQHPRRPHLAGHAIMNIPYNAIRHVPPGSSIRVGCFRRGTGLPVQITDEGQGIA